MMTLDEMIAAYYPNLWNKERIAALTQKGKITAAKYKEIIGEDYTGTIDSGTTTTTNTDDTTVLNTLIGV